MQVAKIVALPIDEFECLAPHRDELLGGSSAIWRCRAHAGSELVFQVPRPCTWKNSSRPDENMARNFTRSSRGKVLIVCEIQQPRSK